MKNVGPSTGDRVFKANIHKALATAACAALCAYLMYLTKGEHGIGWFIVTLFFIW